MPEPTSAIRRASCLAYGIVAYVFFIVVLVCSIGFVGNFWRVLGLNAPWLRGMDYGGPAATTAEALLVDGLLVALFGVQHSVMARPGFKKWWTRFVPAPIERSTYVFAASLCLLVLVLEWRPIGTDVVWDLAGSAGGLALLVVSLCGWAIVALSTFMLDHFELFGLRQVWREFRRQEAPTPATFATPAFYKVVRHPIYFGFMVAFWATPTMTLGHFVFALGMTVYVLFAVRLEERDLVRFFGESYIEYRRRVSMLVPWPRRLRD